MNIVADAKPGQGYELRGDNRALISAKEHEIVNAGPSDTGKSVTCCIKLHLLALRYPGCQLAMGRKIAASLASTVCLTFDRVVTGTKGAPTKVGGDSPKKYQYETGSTIWLFGLDKPEKVLSSERDAIYLCQAEQATLNDWEFLSRTCSGRGALVRTPQLFADANPGGSKHWLRQRAAEGKLRLLKSRHVDNPTLYDAQGNLLSDEECLKRGWPLASLRMKTLMDLSGVRRKRLYEGIWATSEGAVYENFDSSVHCCVRQYSEMKRMFITGDQGFTNPAVALEIGEDEDGRWHVFREFHEKNVLPAKHVEVIVDWWKHPQGVKYEVCAMDESAAGMIAALIDAGVNCVGGKGLILDGIRLIADRLELQGDSRPRLTFDPSCVELINEMESYVWKPEKDVPVKAFDHGPDALRYLENVLQVPTGGWSSAAGVSVGPNTSANPNKLRIPHFVPRRL